MATNFPTSLDTTTTLPTEAATTPLATNHVVAHTNLADSVIALETKVGVNSSAVTSTIDYKLTSTSSIDPGHKHTVTSVTLALDDISDVVLTAPADGNGLTYNSATSKWINSTTTVADASTTVKGVTKLSVAPASPTAPIAVGDNDPRVPTQGENDALAGSSGTPSSSNKYLTQADPNVPQLTDIQTFSTPGAATWTKPTTGTPKKAFVQIWGGGGSGGRVTGTAAGGGGSGYAEKWFDSSALGSTESITVGAGGTAAGSNSNGNDGTNSTFGTSGTLVTGYSGGGGSVNSTGSAATGGGGGGPISSAVATVGGWAGTPIAPSGTSGAAGTNALSGASGGGVSAGNAGQVGGIAYEGGGGGGGAGSTGSAAAGGISARGGAGGAGTVSGAGIAGTQPGGGGGGSANNTSGGAGGTGRVIVTTFF